MVIAGTLQRSRWAKASSYLFAVLLVTAVTGGASWAEGRLSLANLALFYLVPVMIVSGRAGLAAGLFSSMLAAICFNYFLVPPRFTLRIADADNLVTMMSLFVVAAVVSQLAARLRQQAEAADANARTSAILANYGEMLADEPDADAVHNVLASTLSRTFHARVMINATGLEGIDAAAANWSLANNARTGRGTSIMATSEWLFAPLVADRKSYGLVAITRDDARAPLANSDDALFDGLLDRTAQALMRVDLAKEREAIGRHRQHEQLREALLASVGHDLRTPLTTLRAGLDALGHDSSNRSILDTVRTEAGRLDLMVANLLELTRLEAGAVTLRVEAVDLTDVIATALDALKGQIGARQLIVDLPTDLPLVQSDPRLIHPMLLNLIDNACKHGGESAAITVVGRHSNEGVTLSIVDNGPGIPRSEEARIFERFARLEGSDRTGGTGLGLAIVRGFGDALGVETSARNQSDDTGAVFSIRFPPAMIIAHSPSAAA